MSRGGGCACWAGCPSGGSRTLTRCPPSTSGRSMCNWTPGARSPHPRPRRRRCWQCCANSWTRRRKTALIAISSPGNSWAWSTKTAWVCARGSTGKTRSTPRPWTSCNWPNSLAPMRRRRADSRLARHMYLVQRDLAPLGLAGADVGAQQHRGLGAAPGLQCAEYLGVLVVGGVDALVPGEVQPTDDADAFGHVAVHPRHFGIARRLHQRAVKGLVPLAHLRRIAAALRRGQQPWRHQTVQQRPAPGVGPFRVACTEPVRGRGLQHRAQVIELLEFVEIEGQHAPAAAVHDLDMAFLLQPGQRLAHRGARDPHPLPHSLLAETP